MRLGRDRRSLSQRFVKYFQEASERSITDSFPHQVSFELLVKRQIRRLEEPSQRCVELIHEEMQRIIQHCGNEVQQEMLRFPKLHEKIVDVVTQMLRRRLPNTNTMVENLVAIELAYINTKHPDFHKEAALVPSLLKADHIQEPWNHRGNDGNANRRHNRNASPAMHNNHAEAETNNKVEVKGLSLPSVNGSDLIANYSLQQNHVEASSNAATGWLANILPPAASGAKMSDSTESSTTNTPTHSNIMSPLKPVNLLPDVPINPTSRKLTEKEQKDCDVIGMLTASHSRANSSLTCSFIPAERLIKSYYYIVRKSIQDSVPKAIMHFLVNFVKDNLQSELVTHLYKSENAEDFLNESDHIAVRRKEAGDMLKVIYSIRSTVRE